MTRWGEELWSAFTLASVSEYHFGQNSGGCARFSPALVFGFAGHWHKVNFLNLNGMCFLSFVSKLILEGRFRRQPNEGSWEGVVS